MTLPSLDFAVLFVYLAGVVGFGCWFARRSGSTEEFMAAGRCLPGWAVGISIFGTYVSSISFLANPGKSYEGNWNPFVFSLSLPIAAWIAVRWFVPFYRKLGNISAYEHLEQRFGPWARTYAVVCYLLTQLARMGTILYLVALALAPLTGWDVRVIILVTGGLVILYTLLGGIEAVIWTDVVQSIVLTAGMLVAAVLVVMRMPEGPGQVLSIASAHDKFSLGSFGASLTDETFWVVLFYGLFINLQNFGIDQSYVQRYITARDDREAGRSVWIGAWLYLPVSAMLFFVGTALFAFYAAQPELLPDTGDVAIKADAVFPYFIVDQLPTGLTGLLIAAVMAAAMSSVDSSLNSSATLFLCDIYKRFFRPSVGERESMLVLYTATILWGVAGTGAALAMINVETVLDVWWKMAGILSGGMLGLFLLGRLATSARKIHAVVGVIIGVVAILWMSLSPQPYWPQSIGVIPNPLYHLQNPLHGFLTIVVGTLTILLVGWLLTLLTTHKHDS